MLRWTSIGRTQDGKTLKRLHNSTGRTESSIDTTLGSTDTTQTSTDRTLFSVQGSFGLGSVLIPWFDLLKDFYRYKSHFTDTTKLQTEFTASFYGYNDSILFPTAANIHKVVRGLKYKVKAPH
ncbi:hypothetical protein Goklo_004127 [Gossypium klotzschianum]|uniref:Uncharacterized protein n=1 Tax=Gossypium klotzschianum TaxID=34286 RepID=A0A7J8VMM6_9ROSI|nr:hypothetical protein [Gossypium klotzschianum]